MKTVIPELLGIEYPVIQKGGYGMVWNSRACRAVSEAGGLGIIGAGVHPLLGWKKQIHKVKEKTE